MVLIKGVYDKSDVAIVVIIASLIFGVIGGMFSPIRLIALACSPFIWMEICKSSKKAIVVVLCFFLLWYVYSLFSLCWTSSLVEGLKELCYYYCHFSLFFLIVICSSKAKFPLRSIIIGWLACLVLSFPIAFNEIINDVHLASSLHGDFSINIGNGNVVHKKYAAVTFGNYNTYVTLICYSLPFLFAFLLFAQHFFLQLCGWILVLGTSYILVINASRAGILSFVLLFLIFLIYYRKVKFRFKTIFIFGLFVVIFFILISQSEDLFMQLLWRIGENGTSKDVGDDPRVVLIQQSMQLFKDSYFFGTGIGSIVTSLQKVATEFQIPHNLFIEILVQYGLVVFCSFIILLFCLFRRGCVSKRFEIRFVICASLLCLPIVGVINSGYLLYPELWAYFASLFIFSNGYDRF